ncbi:MAG: ATP synthase F1 subunit delta [Planctomycetes bacterium]|nr:ATP synthase F1 subunit delta [Planctomycetota bacterium]
MSEIIRHVVREIYCEVLFELAQEADRVDAVKEDLEAVAHVLSENAEFAALISSHNITGKEKAEIVRRVFNGKVNDLMLDFLSVLAKRNRMTSLLGISQKYETLFDLHYDRHMVEITLAAKPDEKQLEKLQKNLSDAIKGTVKLAVEVDPDIIGGIIIKKDGRMIDNSVRTAVRVAMKTVMDKTTINVAKTGESAV